MFIYSFGTNGFSSYFPTMEFINDIAQQCTSLASKRCLSFTNVLSELTNPIFCMEMQKWLQTVNFDRRYFTFIGEIWANMREHKETGWRASSNQKSSFRSNCKAITESQIKKKQNYLLHESKIRFLFTIIFNYRFSIIYGNLIKKML